MGTMHAPLVHKDKTETYTIMHDRWQHNHKYFIEELGWDRNRKFSRCVVVEFLTANDGSPSLNLNPSTLIQQVRL